MATAGIGLQFIIKPEDESGRILIFGSIGDVSGLQSGWCFRAVVIFHVGFAGIQELFVFLGGSQLENNVFSGGFFHEFFCLAGPGHWGWTVA